MLYLFIILYILIILFIYFYNFIYLYILIYLYMRAGREILKIIWLQLWLKPLLTGLWGANGTDESHIGGWESQSVILCLYLLRRLRCLLAEE